MELRKRFKARLDVLLTRFANQEYLGKALAELENVAEFVMQQSPAM